MSDGRPSAGPGMGGNLNQLSEQMDTQSLLGAAQSKSGSSTLAPGGQISSGPAQAANPRSVGSIPQELIARPLQDIGKELFAFLGLSHQESDPQTKARRQQMLQRYNQLTEEQQAIARQKYQAEQQRKQAEEQEKQARKQQEAQQHADISLPSSPQKGPVGPSGSKKQQAITKLQSDRKTLSGPSSAN